jgi:hypothetical protein
VAACDAVERFGRSGGEWLVHRPSELLPSASSFGNNRQGDQADHIHVHEIETIHRGGSFITERHSSETSKYSEAETTSLLSVGATTRRRCRVGKRAFSVHF